MVKSRRRASSSAVPKTLSRRMSNSSSSSTGMPSRGLVRKVEVSMILAPKKMWASRKRRPMIRQFRNKSLIWLGVAEVAMSKSLGLRPSSRSRTQPPTRYAVCP